MEKELKEFLIVLDILIANHKELVSCEQNKLQLIIAQDWESLGEQLKRSEKILESIATAEKLRVDLTSVVQNLKALNRQIATLLNTSLEVVNFSISLIQGHGADHKTYCMNGEEKKGQENNTSMVLDTRV
jgi:uncharacterized protein YggU (UPF0235/DUF167 family)